MTKQQVLMFHHVLGVTDGLLAFADRLRAAGHGVSIPDLFDGQTFATIDDGVAYASQVGFDTLTDRGVAAAAGMGRFAVVGFSLGVLPAQKLAQTNPNVSAAVLLHGAIPPAMFGDGAWPAGLPLQVHLSPADPLVAEDLDAARELADVAGAVLHTYEGNGHLIADSSSDDHVAEYTDQIIDRVLELFDRLP